MALGLGVLDGELFGLDACHNLEPAQLRNDTVLKAIWALSTFEEQSKTKKRLGRRRVSYAALDVEELGSVYEGLLELHPKADPAAKTFGFVQGTERKSTGSYYTPKDLVAELIKSALEPVLAERLAAAPIEGGERAGDPRDPGLRPSGRLRAFSAGRGAPAGARAGDRALG